MGIAERWLRARFGPELCDHRTYVICSDGDLMEGVSHEAASLAGHLGLGRLIYVYDDNHITIDGPTELAYSDDVAGRFAAYGWHVDELGEVANDTGALEAALRRAADGRGGAVAAHPAQPHRLAVAPVHRHRHGARQPAGRRRGRRDQGDPGPARRTRPSGSPTTCWSCTGRQGAGAATPQTLGEAAGGDARATARPTRPASVAGASGLGGGAPTWQPGESLATRKAAAP